MSSTGNDMNSMTYYCAVKPNGKEIKGTVIFTSEEDCQRFLQSIGLNNDKNEAFRKFSSIFDALKWSNGHTGTSPAAAKSPGRKAAVPAQSVNTSAASLKRPPPASATASSAKRRKKTILAEKQNNEQENDNKYNIMTWDERFQSLKDYKERFATIDVTKDASRFKGADGTKPFNGLYEWCVIQKKQLKAYLPSLQDKNAVEKETEGAETSPMTEAAMNASSKKEKESNEVESSNTAAATESTPQGKESGVSSIDENNETSTESPSSKKVTQTKEHFSDVEVERFEKLQGLGMTVEGVADTELTRRERFLKMLEKLLDFKNEHGSLVGITETNCPKASRYEGLPRWTRGQKERLNKYKEADSASLIASPTTREKAEEYEMLKQIGFGEKKVAARDKKPEEKLGAKEAKWQENFNLMKDYKSIFQTTTVDPVHCQEGKFNGLDIWWSSQKRAYQKFIQRKMEINPETLKTSSITRHVQQLRTIDFNFGGKKNSEEYFEKRMEELQTFKEQHGTCNVTKNTGSNELANFVIRMRSQIIKFKEDPESSILNQEKVDRLLGLDSAIFSRVKPARTLKNHRPKEKNPDEYWEEQFQALVEYKEKNGHTNVPFHPRSPLRYWIVQQRENYSDLQSGTKSRKFPSPLTPERITRLTQLGFDFTIIRRKKFDQRSIEWLQYRAKHGKDPVLDSSKLGRWIGHIRKQYRDFKEGKKSPLTQENVDYLNKYGFIWDTGMKRPDVVTPPKSWEERFQELVEYKNREGHVNVPQKYPILGCWVHTQRQQYMKFKEDKKTTMTKERIEKLHALGFQWVTRKRKFKTQEETEEFKDDGVDSDSEDEPDEQVAGNAYYQYHRY